MDASKNISVIDEFQNKKALINGRLEVLRIFSREIKGKISELETELKDSTPIIEGCDNNILCRNCNIYSMKLLASTPKQEEKGFVHTYTCSICNYTEKQY